MADYDKIKRNIKRMIDQNAPESDINDYLSSEGVTAAQLRNAAPSANPAPVVAPSNSVNEEAAFREKLGGGGFGLQMADTLSFGAFNPISAGLSALGKTAYKGITGQPTDLAGDYKYERDVLDTMLKKSRDNTGIAGTVGEIALSAPLMAPQAAVSGIASTVKASAPTIAAKVGNYIKAGHEVGKAGALYGGIYGFNSARGGIEEHAKDTAMGAGVGYFAAPLLKGGIEATGAISRGTGNLASKVSRYVTSRTPDDIAQANNRIADWQIAGVREFGPAITESTTQRNTAAGLAGSLFGAPLRREAQGAVDDATRAIQKNIRGAIENKDVADAAADVQDTLKRNLTQYSIPDDQIARMSSEERAMITGPMTDSGFASPPPRVEPIPPRNVDPVAPEYIDPNSVSFEKVNPRPVPRPAVEPNYPSQDSFPPDKNLIFAADKAASDAEVARRRFDEAYNQYRASGGGASSPEEWRRIMSSPDGRNAEFKRLWEAGGGADSPALAAWRRAAGAHDNLSNAERIAAESRAAIEEGRRQAWINSSREAHARASKEADEIYAREVEAARIEAERATETNRASAMARAEADARAKAEAETARLRREAEDEATRATERAQFEAQRLYDEKARNSPGFQYGQSRESYPTEFSAAYEEAARKAPDFRSNPLGGPTPEGRAMKTATKDLLASLADEGRRAIRLKKPPYNEDGSISTEFRGYLEDRFGDEIGRRIAELSKVAPGHSATSPLGLKELRTAVRRAAERAERPPYPEAPRTANAAALRRLEKALTEDTQNFTKASGGPAPRFETETIPGEYVGRGSTKMRGMGPSDLTVYIKPENMDRLTGSRMPYDHSGSLPATRQYSVDPKSRTVVVKRNDMGDVNAATRVPFEVKPEVGLRPMQMWGEGSKVHFGAPITSRAMTPGERAAGVIRGVDEAYKEYITELRAPLGKLFKRDVNPIQAMDYVVKAAQEGNLQFMRAYMRVMNEKGDPKKGVGAILAHMTNNASDLASYVKGMKSLPEDTRRIIFKGNSLKQLGNDLKRLEDIATRLEPFEKAIKGGGGVDLTNRANIYIGLTALANFVPSLFAAGTAAAASKFLASPRYVAWMTRVAKIRQPKDLKLAYGKLSSILSRDYEFSEEEKKSILSNLERMR